MPPSPLLGPTRTLVSTSSKLPRLLRTRGTLKTSHSAVGPRPPSVAAYRTFLLTVRLPLLLGILLLLTSLAFLALGQGIPPVTTGSGLILLALGLLGLRGRRK